VRWLNKHGYTAIAAKMILALLSEYEEAL